MRHDSPCFASSVVGATLAMALLLFSNRVAAEIWNRTRGDGVVEFTNHPPVKPTNATKDDKSWNRQNEPRAAGIATFWARERGNGVVEFTNLRPIGANWKVWLKAGPGKAAALRGPSDVVPPRDASSTRYARFDADIQDQQAYYGIPEALVRAVIRVESDYDPRVVSSVGAQGLMQLMPDTARLMGVTDAFEPRQNIMGGSRYLQVLARRFCRTPAAPSAGDSGSTSPLLICSDAETIKVIAGYHAGPGAVEKYGGMPPYETTRSYVTMVLKRYDEYRRQNTTH